MREIVLPVARPFPAVCLPVGAREPFPHLPCRANESEPGDENRLVKIFLDAVRDGETDTIMSCLSKRLAGAMTESELNRLNGFIGSGGAYKCLSAAKRKIPGNMRSNSVYVKNGDGGSIVHVYMVREPDCNGYWKIFNIEWE